MLSWLGYMKHGEPQERVMGLKMPPPNLKPDFEEQARASSTGWSTASFIGPSRRARAEPRTASRDDRS